MGVFSAPSEWASLSLMVLGALHPGVSSSLLTPSFALAWYFMMKCNYLVSSFLALVGPGSLPPSERPFLWVPLCGTDHLGYSGTRWGTAASRKSSWNAARLPTSVCQGQPVFLILTAGGSRPHQSLPLTTGFQHSLPGAPACVQWGHRPGLPPQERE